MSIKKLFDSTNRNYLSNTTTKDAFKNVESSENVFEVKTKQETFIPAVDYSDPKNFVKYGSAYLYYKAAMEQIYDYYPFLVYKIRFHLFLYQIYHKIILYFEIY